MRVGRRGVGRLGFILICVPLDSRNLELVEFTSYFDCPLPMKLSPFTALYRNFRFYNWRGARELFFREIGIWPVKFLAAVCLRDSKRWIWVHLERVGRDSHFLVMFLQNFCCFNLLPEIRCSKSGAGRETESVCYFACLLLILSLFL